jgi:hypothetical protein
MNLEFHAPLVNCLSAGIWRKIGHRVHEINFYPGCSLEYETLKNVILHCANLTSLKLWDGWKPNTSLKMLNYLINKGVKLYRLNTFGTFHVSRRRQMPSPDLLEKIFVIFPCVKRFRLVNYLDSRVRDFVGTSCLSKLPIQLESLSYDVRTNDFWLENPTTPAWNSRFDCFDHYFVLFDFTCVDIV